MVQILIDIRKLAVATLLKLHVIFNKTRFYRIHGFHTKKWKGVGIGYCWWKQKCESFVLGPFETGHMLCPH